MHAHLFFRPAPVHLLFLVAAWVCPVQSTWAHPQASQRELTAAEKAQKSEAIRLYNVAADLRGDGKYSEAIEIMRRVVAIEQKILGPYDPSFGSSINDLAYLYNKLGNRSAAEPLYEQALEISERAFGPNHPETATSLNNLAAFYNDQANYAAAEPLYRRALEIDEKALGPDHPDTAIDLNNLARLYDNQGNYAAAEPLYHRALKIRDEALGPDHPSTAISLNNLAGLYDTQGKYADAEPLYQRALKIEEKAFGPEHPSVARSLNNLAFLYKAQGNFAAAERLYRRALKIEENTSGPEHPSTAISLNNLASLYQDNSSYSTAEPLYKRALKIDEKIFGPNHPSTVRTLENLAALYAAMGRVDQTTELYDKARRGIRHHVTRVLPALSAAEQTLFLSANYETDFHICLTHAFQHRERSALVRNSAAWLINGKAVAQEALAEQNLLARDSNDPVRAPLVRQLLQVRTLLSELVMTAAEPEQTEGRQKKISQLVSQEKSLASQLSGQRNNSPSAQDSWIEFDQVQAALPRNFILIDIARFDGYDFAAKDGQVLWRPARYAAWITPGIESKDPVLVDLGPAKEIDHSVALVRERIQTAANSNGPLRTEGEEAATVSLMKDLAALSARIWEPLQPYLSDAEKIVLSPDGALWLAPWSALPTDAGRFLIEDFDLQFVISGRDLVTRPGKYVTRRSVILANPLFDQNASNKEASIKAIFRKHQSAVRETMRSFSGRKLLPKVSPLPNTGREALAIQPSLDRYSGDQSTLYKERYALERVAKALRSPKVASFATHGFFLPRPESRHGHGERLASHENRASASDKAPMPIENPLLRCGLLLAGCNDNEAVVGDDDGVLTGMEIVGIDFRGTELVVLSACETGLGDVQNGEGVAGLRQAFQLAGAKSVVSTLWQIADDETARLMNEFFRNLADGMSNSEALRRAQLTRIEARRERYGAAHPFFWAAFTLTGQNHGVLR